MSAGITFNETMSGPFALGLTEPEAAARADSRLAMHATVEIDDIDHFVSDPRHLGRLSGTVAFAPLGANLRADTGVFNLFSSTDNPKLKLMIYELGFEHEGQHYYLAGRKHVRDEPGFDIWKDTTTLFTRLHKGPDTSGEVVGAGVLALGVADLARLVSTMRVVGDAHEAPRVLATFGKFFLGELWGSYSRLVTGA
jgi:hypothetical protein